jgi:hypothetical protein
MINNGKNYRKIGFPLSFLTIFLTFVYSKPKKDSIMPKPVIFLAFANDKEDNARYLRNLTKELHEIEEALKPVKDTYEVIHYQGITLKILFDKFQEYKDRIAVFHFGGHADGYQLLLQSDDGGNQVAFGNGLLRFFTTFKESLKLLFFNGCATENLAEDLVNVGLPISIGTNSTINDDVATRLAVRFYKGLATQHTVGKAWEQAVGEIEATYDLKAGTRGLFRKGKEEEGQFAWELFAKEEAKGWKLDEVLEKSYVFNELLTKKVIEAVQKYSNPAKKFLERANTIPNWESQKQISDKAKEVIAYSFVGVIGIQFSKLMAIGKEEFSESKQRKYTEKCIFLVRRSIDLVNFTLTSKLWDIQKSQTINIADEQKKILQTFFENSFEADLPTQMRLLQTLQKIFTQNKLVIPYSAEANFGDWLKPDHAFFQTCQALQKLAQRELANDYAEAERLTAIFFEYFDFLANYKMASIKSIGYKHPRNEEARYLHRYTALGMDSKANVDAEKFNVIAQTAPTESVLLYKGEHYGESINLFPFVIDYNALTFESGAKICFYRGVDVSDGSLDYVFLEDGSVQNISKKEILEKGENLSEILGDKEKAKVLNLDYVVQQFQEAQQVITGEKTGKSVSFDDIFDEA